MMSSRRWRSCGNIIRDEIGRRKIEGLNHSRIEKEVIGKSSCKPPPGWGLEFCGDFIV